MYETKIKCAGLQTENECDAWKLKKLKNMKNRNVKLNPWSSNTTKNEILK